MSLSFPLDRSAQTAWLNQQTPRLKDGDYRRQAVQSFAGDWDPVLSLWSSLAISQQDDELELVDALARWSRNCCVEDEGSRALLPIADDLRSLLWRFSSYESLSDPFRQPVLQALVQLLSNLAIRPQGADELLPVLVEDTFDRNVLVRLLTSDDAATLVGVVTFLFIGLDNAPQHSSLFLAGSGLDIVEVLLRKMEGWFEVEGGGEERCFALGYEILKQLFEAGHMSTLYLSLADAIASSPISLPQILLLKLFDASLHTSTLPSPTLVSPSSLAFLLPTTTRLLSALLTPMRALAAGGPTAQTPFEDTSFAKCHEGFALALKAVIRVALLGAEEGGEASTRAAGKAMVDEVLGEGPFLQSALDLLSLADVYEPRLVRSPASSPSAPGRPDETTPDAFAPVRKDLARLLGIVGASSPVAQDLLAELGALELLLGMCALDVRNPFLREHALFAVRSLLLHHPANQARVRALEPQATIDEAGQVAEVPDRWRKP